MQTSFGKAFEYAVSEAFYKELQHQGMNVQKVDSSKAYITAENKYNSLDSIIQEKMVKAAEASVDTVFKFEPNLNHGSERIEISIQDDSQGIIGDVSDVVIRKNEINWQIGISCKHNHIALKHSRLSDKIDFGKEWLEYPCSNEYWNEVRPQFETYRKMIENIPKNERPLWKEIAPTDADKVNLVYKPILEAFKEELLRLHENNPEVPKRLIHYLLGKKDFYKVISVDREKKTNIQAYNIHDTLSVAYGKEKATHRATKLSGKMPSQIYNISFNNSGTTLIVVMDEGWTVSMRLHNASSKIEPSLKFDIQLTGTPSSLSTLSSYWTDET